MADVWKIMKKNPKNRAITEPAEDSGLPISSLNLAPALLNKIVLLKTNKSS